MYGAKDAEQLLAFYGKLVLTRAKVRTVPCENRKVQSGGKIRLQDGRRQSWMVCGERAGREGESLCTKMEDTRCHVEKLFDFMDGKWNLMLICALSE